MEHFRPFLIAFCLLLIFLDPVTVAYEVSYALNLGGDEFIDSESIRYRADYNDDGGFTQHNRLNLTCAKEVDRKLYEDVHYSNKTFGYELPASQNGHYVLVLKFSTTNPTYPGGHAFDVVLNQQITILSNVNHEKSHGKYCAYDEFIYYTICDGNLLHKGYSTPVKDGKIRIDFRPIRHNIHVSAILLLQGAVGEKVKLTSSNSNDSIYFDPMTMAPCQGRSRIIRAIVSGTNTSDVTIFDGLLLFTINYLSGGFN